MNYFLAKTDPETYSIDQFEREQKTVWDGVKNPQALRAISDMRPGDRVFLYHSGGDAAVVGLAKVVSEPRPDPKSPSSPWSISNFSPARATNHPPRDQGVRSVRRLGACPSGPVIDHGRPYHFRRMDEETVSQDPGSDRRPLHFHGVYFSQNPNPQKKQATNCMKNMVF